MSDASIPLLSRQSGLLETAQIISNNIANASTPGYKSEGTVFSEYIKATGPETPSLSMGHLTGQTVDFTPGAMRQTGGTFDLALSGPGFFKVMTEEGPRLTRAGSFVLNEEGVLTDVAGHPVTDDAGGELQFPPDAVTISIAGDGTISVDEEIFGIVGVFEPTGDMQRVGQNMWLSPDGDQPIVEPSIVQGAVEMSNVDPVLEFANLIHTQRLFEAGQNIVEQDNERLQKLINALRQE